LSLVERKERLTVRVYCIIDDVEERLSIRHILHNLAVLLLRSVRKAFILLAVLPGSDSLHGIENALIRSNVFLREGVARVLTQRCMSSSA
jgi:hypothetical protein